MEPRAVRALLGAMSLDPQWAKGERAGVGQTSRGREWHWRDGVAVVPFEEEAQALDLLGMDIAPVDARRPGFEKHIRRYRHETDMFVMAVVGGGFYECIERVGFERFIRSLKADKAVAQASIRFSVKRNRDLAVRAALSGAHGVMVGDDIAYAGGTFASPQDLRGLLFPLLAGLAEIIKNAGCVPLFHSDGDLRAVFGDIVDAGFEVVHSLQPSAGMGLRDLKEDYGAGVCLMGNVELDTLAAGPPDSVESAVREAIQAAAPGGGFIISTSSGVISERIPVEHVLAFRRAVASHGCYPARHTESR